MRYHILLPLFLAACVSSPDTVKTTFQTSRDWTPAIDVRADAAMIYGVAGRMPLEERIASWKEKGYQTHFMTGIAWGGYQDYFTGEWDGDTHWDEGQVEASGDTIWHGRLVPYIVPTESFIGYFKERIIKRAIDEGIDHIFLEEPEFWSRAGYSDAFKREWVSYYGTPWRPQDESPEAYYLSQKLKYHLYQRALNEAFTYAKEYGKSKGRDIKCYVPTHSLINYSKWHIVSPEASLASLDCVDGYIAQVWTGTSRSPVYYNGKYKERIFETAFLEYGCMQSMTSPTGRQMWFLTDPIEDASRDWEDYRRGYHATFTAQLLYPQVNTYEIMPWPDRIYNRPYPVRPGSAEKAKIPAQYATMMQVMTNALQNMPKAKPLDAKYAVLMGNSLMFQEDEDLSGFFGLALPLLKRGVPVDMVHMENLGYKDALKGVEVLVMTYSNMKPFDAQAHSHIAEWVRRGGRLLYCGRDDDPFQCVGEWWNTGENSFATPSEHLFQVLGIPADEGTHRCGKGVVSILRQNPQDFARQEGGEKPYLEALEAIYRPMVPGNTLRIERGAYRVVAVMDEGPVSKPHVEEGCLIDLYDPDLPVYSKVVMSPGSQGLYYDVAKAPRKAPAILAAASRAYDEKWSKNGFSYTCKGPLDTWNVTRILLPGEPAEVLVDGQAASALWDNFSGTVLLRFPNSPEGVHVEICW